MAASAAERKLMAELDAMRALVERLQQQSRDAEQQSARAAGEQRTVCCVGMWWSVVIENYGQSPLSWLTWQLSVLNFMVFSSYSTTVSGFKQAVISIGGDVSMLDLRSFHPLPSLSAVPQVSPLRIQRQLK
jgi:hypothetical protein